MFMKLYAPNRCETSIEALNFRGDEGRGGGIRADVNGEVMFLRNLKKKKNFFYFFFGGGGSGPGGGGVRVDLNGEVKSF